MSTGDVELRAYRFALDLVPAQEQQVRQHADARNRACAVTVTKRETDDG